MAPERVTGADLPKEVLDEFKASVKGKVVVKGEVPEAEYQAAIDRWNKMHVKEAHIISMVENEDDISKSIKFAVRHNVDLVVAGGRHTHSGPSSGYGLVIDLRNMRKVTIDVEKKTATAQGGCVAGDVEHAAEEHKLRPMMGAVNATGVGGITTGGGIGNLAAQHGLVCDNLFSARVCSADGVVRVASDSENPDLFWGIRGGGSNFGVVSEFTYKLHDCDHLVYSGILAYTPDKMEALVKIVNSYYFDYTCKAEGKLAVSMFLGHMTGSLAPGVVVFYDGSKEEATPWIQPWIDIGPVMIQVGEVPYSASTEWAQFEALIPKGFDRVCGSSTQMAYPVDEDCFYNAIKTFFEVAEKHSEDNVASKLIIDMRDYRKIASVPKDATAYYNRSTGVLFASDFVWKDASLDQVFLNDARAWSKALRENVKAIKERKARENIELPQQKAPLENGSMQMDKDGYDVDEDGHVAATTLYALLTDGQEKMGSVFGKNLPRLSQIKAKYDPNLLFDKWYPIPPAEIPN